MDTEFKSIRVFLLNELKNYTTIKKNEKLDEHNIEHRIYAIEKIVKMLKETVSLYDNEIEKDKAHMKTIKEDIQEDLPF